MLNSLVRVLLLPLIWTLRFFVPKLNQRILFEQRNKNTESIRFADTKEKAAFCFHVSSEGELEQAMPLVRVLLSECQKVEIIFTSPSVEHKLLKLFKDNQNLIRILRLPVLTFNPLDYQTNLSWWVSANNLIMVRYDFFPELMKLGSRKKNFVLINASLKSKEDNSFKSYLYRRQLKKFTHIISANEKEAQALKILGLNIIANFDFRVIQIENRLSNSLKVLSKAWPSFTQFEKYLTSFDKKDRFIYGSFWAEDAKRTIFGEDQLHIIVPHDLRDENLDKIKDVINHDVITVDINTDLSILEREKRKPLILLLSLKGILCELYPFFSQAYIGGGFGVSIHSVLEPFIAGCLISCGPVNHRSTEIDYIQSNSPQMLTIFKDSIHLTVNNTLTSSVQNYDEKQLKLILDFFKGIAHE